MSLDWNPIKPDRYYFVRSSGQCVGQFLEFLIGSGTAGFIDYLLIFPLIFIALMNYCRFRCPEFISFPILVLKIIIAAPLTLVFLPFIFIYNEIALFIGKPLKKLFENLEVLPFAKHRLGKAEDYNLLIINESTEPKNYAELEAMLPKGCGTHTLALFNDDSLYYIDKKLMTMQKIEKGTTNYRVLVHSLRTNPEVHNTITPYDFLYKEIQNLISPIHRKDYSSLDFDNFYNSYYDDNTENSSLLETCHHQSYEDLIMKPMYVSIPPNSKRMVLGLFDDLYSRDLPHSFIVPSKENKASLKPLLKKNLLNFQDIKPGFFEELTKLLDEEDPFQRKKREEKEHRIETTVLLIKTLCPNPKAVKQKGSEAFNISKEITEFAGLKALNQAEKAEVEVRLDSYEESAASLNR